MYVTHYKTMYQIATNCNTPPTYPPITSATHCNTIQQAATRWNCQSSKSFGCSMPRSIGYFCVRACLMVLNPSRAANQDLTLVENSSLRHSPTQVSFHGTHTVTHAHTYTYTYTYTYTHAHTYTHTHVHTYTAFGTVHRHWPKILAISQWLYSWYKKTSLF